MSRTRADICQSLAESYGIGELLGCLTESGSEISIKCLEIVEELCPNHEEMEFTDIAPYLEEFLARFEGLEQAYFYLGAPAKWGAACIRLGYHESILKCVVLHERLVDCHSKRYIEYDNRRHCCKGMGCMLSKLECAGICIQPELLVCSPVCFTRVERH